MRNKLLLASIIFITAFSSCTTYRYMYAASPPNNPYFTQKGESKLTGYYSSSDNNIITKEFADGFDFHAAYAIGDHWALAAGYYNRRERDVFSSSFNLYDTSTINYKRNLFDIGGGYFVPLSIKKGITFNLYGGMALGKFSLVDNGIDKNQAVYNRYHNSHITKWFFQPAINFMPGRYVRFSFITKFSFVHYGNIQTSYTPDEVQYFSLNRIKNRTVSFIEPSLNFQFGLPKYPWVKLDAGISSASNPFRDVVRLDVRGSNASIGLSFDFSKMKKGK